MRGILVASVLALAFAGTAQAATIHNPRELHRATVAHVEDNIAAAGIELTDEEYAALSAAVG